VAKAPSWAADGEDPRFPRSRFITGVGFSQVNAEAAEESARNAVSTQISARLESETTSFAQFSSKSGETSESVTARVSVRSSFNRADLIRFVDRARQGDTWYARAALERAAADRELAAAAAPDLARFKAASDVANKAHAEHDAGIFASAAGEASRFRAGLDASFIVRRAVAQTSAPEEAEYLALRNRLLAQVAESRSRRVVGVVLKGAAAGHVADLAVNAVKRLGLRPDFTPCSSRPRNALTDATQLEVEPAETCAQGNLGERCEVTVRLIAHACAGGTAGAGTIAGIRALHPSDREKARRSAWDKVTAEVVEAAVRDALKSTLQIGE
jgi:hypothetical protein